MILACRSISQSKATYFMYFVYLLRMETFLQGGKQKKRSEGNRRKRKSHGGGVPEFSHLDSG